MIPVCVPALNPDVFSAIEIGMQVPGLDEQVRDAPVVGASQLTELDSFGDSAPSASLYISTVCAFPFAPGAIETGPTVLETRRSLGEALSTPVKKNAALSARKFR
jgi:hypothetical protein